MSILRHIGTRSTIMLPTPYKWKNVVTTSTLIFLCCFVVEASVPKLLSNVGQDYVSLSTENHQAYHHPGMVDNDDTDATIWIVGATDCSSVSPGCVCSKRFLQVSASIVCTCQKVNEVVHLKGDATKPPLANSVSWEVKGCSKVVVHPAIFATFFNRTSSLTLKMKFSNISQLIILEEAFSMKDSSLYPHESVVEFNNCDIPIVPPKTFPSSLELLTFINSRIQILAKRFISALKMKMVEFRNVVVDNVQADAFHRNVLVDNLQCTNTRFKNIHESGVVSGMQKLNWTNTSVDKLSRYGLGGQIASVHMQGCRIVNVQTSGFAVTTWSYIELINNVFHNVSSQGISLIQVEAIGVPSIKMRGNSWGKIAKDFVTLEVMSESLQVDISNNTFLQNCSCETPMSSYLSSTEMKASFRDAFLSASRCPLTTQQQKCLLENGNSSLSDYLWNQDFSQLCSERVFMCTSEVMEMHAHPKLPNRLQLLALFIGAFALFMVVTLLLTLVVYMCRKKPRKEDGHDDLKADVPHMNCLDPDPYGTNGTTHSKMTKTPSVQTRLALLEDVEMEDKGVQTLPTDLSADILEGLRLKLSKPDSDAFWDAKETLDHLYDLINVKEQSALSSRPDVTCNDERSETTLRHVSSDSLRPLMSPSKRPTFTPLDRSPRHRPFMTTFAQSPTSTSPTKSVGVGPGQSDSHIYSELSAFNRQSRTSSASSPDSQPPPLPTTAPPILCEYTEPRDFQTHIYAELSSSSSVPETSVDNPAYGIPPQALSTSVINSPNKRQSMNITDLGPEPPSSISTPTHVSSRIPIPNTSSTSSSPKKRPLPSIPAKPNLNKTYAS